MAIRKAVDIGGCLDIMKICRLKICCQVIKSSESIKKVKCFLGGKVCTMNNAK